MAVIIDEFQVVLDESPTTPSSPTTPQPVAPQTGLNPQTLRDMLRREAERALRLYAH